MLLDMTVLSLSLSLAGVIPPPDVGRYSATADPVCTDDVAQIREALTLRDDTPRPAWASAEVPDVVWRLVEAASSEADDRRRRCLLDAAEDEARTTLDPSSVAGRFSIAVVLGVRADTEGGRTRVHAASALHSELAALLEIAPDHARARHMLGRVHAGVRRMNSVTRWLATNLLGGDALRQATWETAEENLVYAERTAPEVIDHHLQLANLYRDTDRPELALEELGHVMALPAVTPREAAARAEAEAVRHEVERRLNSR